MSPTPVTPRGWAFPALTRRGANPVFAAWDAALSIARERLADTLLARSMEGNIEQIWRDGVIVGERHVIDNRLGLAILRRLDRLAEGGVSVGRGTCPSPANTGGRHRTAKASTRRMRSARFARATMKASQRRSHWRNPTKWKKWKPLKDGPAREPTFIDLSDRCWRDGIEGIWMTDFPPPPAFRGYQSRAYDELGDEERYVRTCTDEEAAILDAGKAADCAAERAEDEELRDAWFNVLRADLENGDDPTGVDASLG